MINETQTTPTCSVVIVNWNGLQHLQVCLTSLEKQLFTDFEVILVDNASTDGSLEFLQSRFPRVRLLSQDRNLGFAGGCNAGIREARGRYVALLNNDTEADPGWLQELIAAIESNPNIGFCASKILFFDDRRVIDAAGDGFGTNGIGFKRGHGEFDKGYDLPTPVFGACAAAALYRRSLFERVGYFDEDFFLIFEDVDLSFRARLAGFQCLFVPTARVYHKSNASIGTLTHAYVYYGHRNLEFVFFQNMPPRLLLRHAAGHFLYDALALLYFARHGRMLSFLKAKAAVLRSLPSVFAKRRRVQAARVLEDRQLAGLLSPDWLARARGRHSTTAAPAGDES